MTDIVSVEAIANKIYFIRGMKVMLDRDLAELYGVENKALNQAVKRNIKRFPDDFMFQLTYQEFTNLKSQFVTSSWGGVRKMPHAFTEQGVAMLSGILNSDRAIAVNIQIMRTFTRLRQAILENADLKKELEDLKQLSEERFRIVFETLDQLLTVESKPKKIYPVKFEDHLTWEIGFTVKEKVSKYGLKN